jgi:DeoR family transcriptional regulator, suf operon transcriptional repressor
MTTTESYSTKQEILPYLLKQGQATAQQLAKALSISRQAIQRHLKNLQNEQLIEYQPMPVGMGRPHHVYQLSRQGRASFPHSYDEFAISFLDTLTDMVGEEQVRTILRQQWERKVVKYRQYLGNGSLQERVAKLVELRQREGYMAEWRLVVSGDPSNSKDKFVLTEHNCAIAKIAKSCSFVCGHELEIFAAVLPECIIERTQWMNSGDRCCGYSIQAK